MPGQGIYFKPAAFDSAKSFPETPKLQQINSQSEDVLCKEKTQNFPWLGWYGYIRGF